MRLTYPVEAKSFKNPAPFFCPFFFSTSIFLLTEITTLCVVNWLKKARKIRYRGDSVGKSVRVCLRFPRGNKKSFSLRCVIFIYIPFPLCFFIYTVCGAGVKIICISISDWLQALSNDTLFHTIQRAIISPPPLSPLPAGSSHTHAHTLPHTWMQLHDRTHTHHLFPSRLYRG